MGVYNEFIYSDGTRYGTVGSLSYSGEPVTASSLFYDSVKVSWSQIATAPGEVPFTKFRLVRNQEGFPQTQEDGVVLYETDGAPTNLTFTDSSSTSSAPLLSGRFAYYRLWVKRVQLNGAFTAAWTPAGDAYTLVPSPHGLSVPHNTVYSAANGASQTSKDLYVSDDSRVNTELSTTHQRFLGLLPKVLTSITNSSVDADNHEYTQGTSGALDNSLISTFLSAFSFTFDEFLTFASLIKPDFSAHSFGPSSIALATKQLGLTNDVESVTSTQKKLVRNAAEIYRRKGTQLGVELLAQSMTGYDSTVKSTSDNRSCVVSTAAAANNIITFLAPNDFSPGEFVTVSNLTVINGADLNVSNTVVVASDPKFFSVIALGVVGLAAGPGYAVPVTTQDMVTWVTGAHNLLLSHEDATFDIPSWRERADAASAADPVEPAPEIGNWKTDTNKVTISVVSDQTLATVDTASGARVVDSTYCLKATTSAANQTITLGGSDPVNSGIPVVPMQPYTLSVYVKESDNGSGETELSLTITWYDRMGVQISTSSASKSSSDGIGTSWSRQSVTGSAPINAVYAGVSVTFAESSETYWIDRVQFEQNPAATAYQEPRGVVVTLNPTNINYIQDPSIQKHNEGTSTLTYWGGTNATTEVTITDDVIGEKAVLLTANGSGPAELRYKTSLSVIPGQYYSGSMYVKNYSMGGKFKAVLKIYALDGTTLLRTVYGDETDTTASGWTRVSASTLIPAYVLVSTLPVVPGFVKMSIVSVDTPASGAYAYLDDAQFEKSYAPTDYFDGSFTNDGNVWQGTANSSFSGKYPAYSTRATRLAAELKDYIGYSTPWWIDTYGGTQFKGMS